MTGYGTRDVAKVLGLAPARVRSFVRAGLLAPRRGPRGHYRFSFPDLVFLRAASCLEETRIPQRRIRRALRKLVKERPRGFGLSDLVLAAEGSRVVVDDGTARWDPQSGQTLFDFGGGEPATPVAPVAPLLREGPEADAAAAPASVSAEDWHGVADELETTSPEEARLAYEKALALDSGHADSHLNLGRLLHEQGDIEAALAHYRAALAARPDDATAAFNLGVALEDSGRLREALAAYERAVDLDDSDSDAHFNAASLAERLGEISAALGHWKSYRRLTRPD